MTRTEKVCVTVAALTVATVGLVSIAMRSKTPERPESPSYLPQTQTKMVLGGDIVSYGPGVDLGDDVQIPEEGRKVLFSCIGFFVNMESNFDLTLDAEYLIEGRSWSQRHCAETVEGVDAIYWNRRYHATINVGELFDRKTVLLGVAEALGAEPTFEDCE